MARQTIFDGYCIRKRGSVDMLSMWETSAQSLFLVLNDSFVGTGCSQRSTPPTHYRLERQQSTLWWWGYRDVHLLSHRLVESYGDHQKLIQKDNRETKLELILYLPFQFKSTWVNARAFCLLKKSTSNEDDEIHIWINKWWPLIRNHRQRQCAKRETCLPK